MIHGGEFQSSFFQVHCHNLTKFSFKRNSLKLNIYGKHERLPSIDLSLPDIIKLYGSFTQKRTEFKRDTEAKKVNGMNWSVCLVSTFGNPCYREELYQD